MLTYEIINSKLNKLQANSWEDDVLIEQVLMEMEELFEKFNLTVSLKTTLSTKKGSIHYHLKKDKEKGVLEATFWPKTQQLWLEIHDNRRNEWNECIIKSLAESLASVFQGEIQVTDHA